MRRLLYLALVLVLLAMTGLAFVRVTGSPAYLARALVLKIEPGMRREDVRNLMINFPDVTADSSLDCWTVAKGYWLAVDYEGPIRRETVAVVDPNQRVRRAWFVMLDDPTVLDETLEFFGYPGVP